MSKFNLQNELLDRARLAKQLEDYLGAEKLVKRAIALTRQEGGPEEHTITRYLTRELAGIHVKAGSPKKAENAWKSHLKSLRQIKKNTETEQLEISKTMVQMALFYQSQDLARQAKIRYGQALKIQEPPFSKENPDYVLTLSEYARILCREGKRRKAESLFLEALKLAENILGDWDEYVALVLRRRALAFKGLVNPEPRLFLNVRNNNAVLAHDWSVKEHAKWREVFPATIERRNFVGNCPRHIEHRRRYNQGGI